jgi:hypothetical protein
MDNGLKVFIYKLLINYRLIDGINSTKTVISNVFNRLIGVSDISCIEVSNRLKVVEETTLNGSKTLIVFNQLAHPIQEVVCLKTSSLLKVTLMSQPNFKVDLLNPALIISKFRCPNKLGHLLN